MLKCKREDCRYRERMIWYGNTSCCGYMLYHGEPRGCNPEKCDKYAPVTQEWLKEKIEKQRAAMYVTLEGKDEEDY